MEPTVPDFAGGAFGAWHPARYLEDEPTTEGEHSMDHVLVNPGGTLVDNFMTAPPVTTARVELVGIS